MITVLVTNINRLDLNLLWPAVYRELPCISFYDRIIWFFGIDPPVISLPRWKDLVFLRCGVIDISCLFNLEVQLIWICPKVNTVANSIQAFLPDQIKIGFGDEGLISSTDWKTCLLFLMAWNPVLAIAIFVGADVWVSPDDSIGDTIKWNGEPFDGKASINEGWSLLRPEIVAAPISELIPHVTAAMPPTGAVGSIFRIFNWVDATIDRVVVSNREVISFPGQLIPILIQSPPRHAIPNCAARFVCLSDSLVILDN